MQGDLLIAIFLYFDTSEARKTSELRAVSLVAGLSSTIGIAALRNCCDVVDLSLNRFLENSTESSINSRAGWVDLFPSLPSRAVDTLANFVDISSPKNDVCDSPGANESPENVHSLQHI